MSGKSSVSESARSSPSQQPAERRNRHDSIVCRPLDSLSEIKEFLNDPPAWRSLCTELRPHSEYAIKNMDIVLQNHGEPEYEIQLEKPETFCHFAVDKDVGRHRRKDLPKTLVCHDMANGYHDDSIIDGTGNHEAYSFYNWAVVDIFCYFSHHFVTVPPLGWINVAHAHGVKVIGTVITEWGAGAAIWESLLAAPERWEQFARSLVAVAKTLRFDGWLLNVENQISKPAALIEFVRHLHSLLHSELAQPVLLWYDSVTHRGRLAWQNGLTENNRAFFSACDGIFTNYSWKEEDIRKSCVAAGARVRDVFVGLDVWGRNFLGGGQFNTQEAVKIAHKHGCSLAIFAPAWTHEAVGGAPASLDVRRRARLRERALWGSLWPFLSTKLPSELPFSTAFCTGQGTERRLYGEVVSGDPWYNLRHQHYQPNSSLGPHGYRLVRAHIPCAQNASCNHQPDDKPNKTEDLTSEALETNMLPPNATSGIRPKFCKTEYQLQHVEEAACLELWLQDSFTGGGCLLVTPPDCELVRLFHCDLLVEDTLVACVVTKALPEHEDQFLDLVLLVKDHDGRESRVVLGSAAAAGPAGAVAVPPATAQGFKDLQRYLLLHQPGFYVSVENCYGWKVRYYSVQLRGRVTALGALGGPGLLGHLGLCRKFENKD